MFTPKAACKRRPEKAEVRRRVELSSKMPSNWKSFLRVNDNTTELFHLLAEEATGRDFPQKQVFSTYGDKVFSAPGEEIKYKLNPARTKKPIQD